MLEQPEYLNLVVKLGKPGGFAGIHYDKDSPKTLMNNKK
mgnify:CR=1 FL=1